MDKGSGAVRRVPFWRSLQTKFALTYIVIVAAVLILLNTYPLVVSEKLAYQSKQASMLNQASVLASALATGPEALTAEGATRTVELLRGSLGVTRVVVTDPNGLVLCDFQDGVGRTDTAGRYALFWELVTALRGNNVFRSEYGDGAFRSWAAVPITYRSMTQGAVYLYEYDAEQGALLQGIQTNLRFISIVICMVSLVMGVVFSKALTRRIAQLLRGIHTVREGEYSHRVSVRGGDELSRLADEFNELTGRLQTTEEVRRRFVSDASHELKTPLASIRLLTDSLLQADHMDGETAREFLNDIGDEADRLTRITEKLLTLTRLDTAPAAEDVPVDVGAVVERVEHMLSPLARAVEVSLELKLQPGCVVLATEDDLYQIAFNLMENAVKYNLPGGRVLVTLTADGGRVVLRVEDTGVGIPEADLPKIFDRFYRVDKARSRAAGGTGLGLSIVRDTVLQHGGGHLLRGQLCPVERRGGGPMRRRIAALGCLLALAAGGCAPRPEEPEGGYCVYYSALSDRFAPLPLDCEPFEGSAGDPIPALVDALLSPPETQGLATPFPEGVRLLSWELEEGRLHLDLSEQYGGLSGVDLTVADACLTLTLCQVEGVESVYVTVEGREIPYRRVQQLGPDGLLLTDGTDVPPEEPEPSPTPPAS